VPVKVLAKNFVFYDLIQLKNFSSFLMLIIAICLKLFDSRNRVCICAYPFDPQKKKNTQAESNTSEKIHKQTYLKHKLLCIFLDRN